MRIENINTQEIVHTFFHDLTTAVRNVCGQESIVYVLILGFQELTITTKKSSYFVWQSGMRGGS